MSLKYLPGLTLDRTKKKTKRQVNKYVSNLKRNHDTFLQNPVVRVLGATAVDYISFGIQIGKGFFGTVAGALIALEIDKVNEGKDRVPIAIGLFFGSAAAALYAYALPVLVKHDRVPLPEFLEKPFMVVFNTIVFIMEGIIGTYIGNMIVKEAGSVDRNALTVIFCMLPFFFEIITTIFPVLEAKMDLDKYHKIVGHDVDIDDPESNLDTRLYYVEY